MKKNKTVAYMLAATLLVGGTFLGTKALFTDTVDTAGEVKISTGDVDLEIQGEPDWALVRNGEEENKGTGEKVDFDNLKTGDVLTKELTVVNNGTLTAIVDLEKKNLKDDIFSLPEGIKYTATITKDEEVLGNTKGIVMNPTDTIKINLKLEVTGGGQHNAEGSINSNTQEEKTINLTNSYVLNATQKTAENDK